MHLLCGGNGPVPSERPPPLKIYLLYVWVFCLPICMPMHHMHAWFQGGAKRTPGSLELELQTVVSHLRWLLGT